MSARKLLELGAIGKVPVDTLFELYLETKSGDTLTFYQTRCSASIGGWVYEAAACLAQYLESDHFRSVVNASDEERTPDAVSGHCVSPKAGHPLDGRKVVELGAGTGIVGIMAAYHGSESVITDLDSLVPLIDFNIRQNSGLLKGGAVAEGLCWGTAEVSDRVTVPDFLVLANCVYYESSLEPLLETVLKLTNRSTLVLACYEERTAEIRALIKRWHDLVLEHFSMEEVDRKQLESNYWKDYVRVVILRRK